MGLSKELFMEEREQLASLEDGRYYQNNEWASWTEYVHVKGDKVICVTLESRNEVEYPKMEINSKNAYSVKDWTKIEEISNLDFNQKMEEAYRAMKI